VSGRRLALAAGLLLAIAAAAGVARGLPSSHPRSVDQVVKSIEGTAGARMRASLAAAGVPARARLTLVGLKDQKRLELWGDAASGARVLVRAWPVLAASGRAGPKLREGDGQVPEGIYRIDRLNPNSAFHLSLGLDYPNAADRARAARDGRTRLGGDIFIHGDAVSIGCLAIGDEGIEELFWLVATVGKSAFTVVLVPTDLRRNPPPRVEGVSWAPELYRDLEAALVRAVGAR
jgi:hypothetical protein